MMLFYFIRFLFLFFSLNYCYASILVTGNKIVSEQSIINRVSSINDSDRTDELVIQSLMSTGYFDNVAVERNEGLIKINVLEKAIVKEIKYNFKKNLEEVKDIVKKQGISIGRFIDDYKLLQLKDAIETSFLQTGSSYCVVDVSLSKQQVININVVDYSNIRLNKIVISGNKHYSKQEILDNFISVTKGFMSLFSKDNYDYNKYQYDLEKLREMYLDSGFLNYNLESSKVLLTDNQRAVNVFIKISEGEQFKFNELSVTGEYPKEIVTEEQTSKLIVKGENYSRESVQDLRTYLESKLVGLGHLNAVVEIEHEIEPKDRLVNLSYVINTNNKYVVNKINIRGNTFTHDEILRKDINLLEGQTYDKTKVKQAEFAWRRAGLAESVAITEKVIGDNKLDIDIDIVEPDKTRQIGLGMGYNMSDKLTFNFNLKDPNFFGTGIMLDTSFETNPKTDQLSFNYYDPYFTVDEKSLGIHTKFENSIRRGDSNKVEYRSRNIDIGFTLGYKISNNTTFNYGLGCEYLHYLNKSESKGIKKEFFDFNAASKGNIYFSSSIKSSTLDHFIFPNSGSSINLTAKTSLPILKKSFSFYTLGLEASTYLPIYKDSFIYKIGTNLNYVNNWNGKPIPLQEYHFLGGEEMRGFSDSGIKVAEHHGTVNSDIGGKFLYYISQDFIFPFIPSYLSSDAIKGVRNSIFIDIGGVENSLKYNTIVNNARCSVGYNLTWNSPLGVPINIGTGYKIKSKSMDEWEGFFVKFKAKF